MCYLPRAVGLLGQLPLESQDADVQRDRRPVPAEVIYPGGITSRSIYT
jgi:hypothetical protein